MMMKTLVKISNFYWTSLVRACRTLGMVCSVHFKKCSYMNVGRTFLFCKAKISTELYYLYIYIVNAI